MANNGTPYLITDNQAFIRLLLDNACPAYEADGIVYFMIETHCVLWTVGATKDEEGWVILSMRSPQA